MGASDESPENSGRVIVPPEAPECTSEPPSLVQVTVLGMGVSSESTRVLDGHVMGQGVGLPESISELPRGAEGPEQVGWLQLEGATRADAGAGDVPRWTIVGPRAIGEIAAPAGTPTHVSVELPSGPFYLAQHFEIVVTLGERLALFQQVTERDDKLGSREGFSLERGAPVCQQAFKLTRDGAPCYYNYYHALEVTVPGGAAATLALGEARTVGDYQLLHGTTGSLSEPATSFNQGAGECNDNEPSPSQFTAILLPR